VIDQQNLVGDLLNRAGDPLAVLAAEDESAQNEKVERALEQRDTVGVLISG
jgi:hypothetical protein